MYKCMQFVTQLVYPLIGYDMLFYIIWKFKSNIFLQ